MLETPLVNWHEAHNGRMVDFAGWRMPVQYSSIVEEHLATRQVAGMFDVSHMGRLTIGGPYAMNWLDALLSRKILGMNVSQCRYTLITTEDAILDDAIVSREPDAADGSPCLGLIVNASNRERVVDWFNMRLPKEGVTLKDHTSETAMMAIQGPRAIDIVASLLERQESQRLSKLSTYTLIQTTIIGHSATISRTGYTGEDGLEIVVPASAALEVWEEIYKAGVPLGLHACGLGSRDTLRLEAGMPLYGHELTEISNPFAIGLGFAMTLKDHIFPGHDRFIAMKNTPDSQVRIGLVFDSKRTARTGCEVFSDEVLIGTVTSGSFAPSLGKAVAMAVINCEAAVEGNSVEVVVRGSKQKGRVTSLPFYKRD
jgi:aminomethyltransferase